MVEATSSVSASFSGLASKVRIRLVERRRREAAAGRISAVPLEQAVREEVDDEAAVLSVQARDRLCELILREATGLGPLEELLADPDVEEVMVNGAGNVFAGVRGTIEPTDIAFSSPGEVIDAVERVLAPIGRRVDETSPIVDARLADGSRLNVVLPPLSVDGPVVTIRRFTGVAPGPDGLVAAGAMGEGTCERLADAVRARRTILVSGGTSAGKTTLLNALASFIPPDERIVTIEDAAELRLGRPHVIRLEARPAGPEGRGEVTIRALLRNALRMRPDRIVIGEVRGAEAMDLLSALNTGHSGALSTVHANSPEEALTRIETLALMAGLGLPHELIRRQALAGIDEVVHVARFLDGSRRVVGYAEVRNGSVHPVELD